ncbi:uncharacterized protein FIBRA_00868 [Fibroporia radiculosa]|uniref:Xylanolytic transcriptional activator regulatory domain-containing protein n=1 Tax=Fibroporia radiculosa TaxID=599839 RepID=J4I863_9APHY|nr:uncharacterized protein FIBRA_00868 [Fibroporia radiculosa]CCL98861.1 predicted protein [Fibroporia radiculosa]
MFTEIVKQTAHNPCGETRYVFLESRFDSAPISRSSGLPPVSEEEIGEESASLNFIYSGLRSPSVILVQPEMRRQETLLNPDCTFDILPDLSGVEQRDPPKSRFEKLENRINELEALLSTQGSLSTTPSSRPTPEAMTTQYVAASPSPSTSNHGLPISVNGFAQVERPPDSVVDPILLNFDSLSRSTALDSLADAAMLIETSAINPDPFSINLTLTDNTMGEKIVPLQSPDPLGQVIALAWPKSLPHPELLRHLVDAYFSFNADANRLFHRPSFMASLSLPPTHPKFPLTPLLHAMCAIGSLYTAVVAPVPNVTTSPIPIGEKHVYQQILVHEQRPLSFAEIHAGYARRAIDAASEMGEELFQMLQAEILLVSWNWASAKWAEAYMCISRALRTCIPLGLNVGASFHTISESFRPPSIIPPPRTPTEDETRRNAFWIAYSLERSMGCGHGWALMIDDQDVTQLLPIHAPPSERQWSHAPDVLVVHPPEQADSFVMYVKACMLLSRVKSFNARFRAKLYAGDPSMATYNESDTFKPKDMRTSPAFQELTTLIGKFKDSFPAHLRNPVENGLVDSYLFSACTAPWLAFIILHEPHAHVWSPVCDSALKILNSSRAILNLVYDVYATSYDLALLSQFSILSWFMAGRVLVRFLQAAFESGEREIGTTLLVEIDFIRTVLSQVGERVPLAHRYGKMLEEFICKHCGRQYVNTLPASLPPRGYAPFATNGEWPNTSDLVLNLQVDSSAWSQ